MDPTNTRQTTQLLSLRGTHSTKRTDLLAQNPSYLSLEHVLKPLVRDGLHREDLDDPLLLVSLRVLLCLYFRLSLPHRAQVVQGIELGGFSALPHAFLRGQDTSRCLRAEFETEVFWVRTESGRAEECDVKVDVGLLRDERGEL